MKYFTISEMLYSPTAVKRGIWNGCDREKEDNLEALSSEFGELQRNLTSDITATAEGVLQSYGYEERITGLETEAGTTDSFIRKTNQYIFSGLIDEDTMTYGIAVGEGVTKDDGTLDNNARCATFSMNEMAFWQGTTKMAWFSSGKFYINNGQIENSLQIGNFMWKKIEGGAMALVAT